jgi:uncharacterized protein (TIGR03437 family)
VNSLYAQMPSLDLKTIPTKTTPESLVVGDFNGDGKPDLAVSGDDSAGKGTVEILLGNGDGTFRSASVIEVGAPATRIAKADFNNDGKLDLAVSVGNNGHVMILLGNGDGTFQTPMDSGASTPSGQLSALIPGMAVGDVNGDGKPDLVLGPYTFTSTSSVAVMLGNGDGTFSSPVNSSLDRIDIPKSVVADLNGDGRADMFVSGWSTSDGQRYGRLLGNADGSMTIAWSTYTYPFSFGSILTVHDVNGNGKPDVIAIDYLDYPVPGRLTFWGFLDGSLSATACAVEYIPEDSEAGLDYVSMTAGDVNGDGKQDLLVTDPRGNLLIMLGDGLGTFGGPPQDPPASPSPTIYTGASSQYTDHWGSVTTADFRGVGKQDVVMALAGKSVALLLNGGESPVVSSLNNAASLAATPAVPGSLMTAFGSGLAYGSGTTQPGSGPGNGAAATLFGLTMQIDGTDAPLLYASPTQANIQIPWEISGQTQATLLTTRNGVTQSMTIPLATYAPGLFTTNGDGTGQAAALIVATPPVIAAPAGSFPGSRPIHAGEYLSLYGTGLGAVNSPQATNTLAYCCDSTPTTPVVTIGGATATVQFSGLAPGLLGVYQVNILIPANAPTGSAVPVVLDIGGVASNTVTIAIQ